MDTQLFEAFIAVAESGSFSAAAERVHLTQPAVSKRIAQLEDQMDCRLFDRFARRIALTEAGTALLPKARDIVLALEDTRQSLRDLSGSVSGRLKLGISHHIGLHRLPPVLKAFTRKYPKVDIQIDFIESEAAADRLRHSQVEVAVVTLAPAPEPGLISQILWHDQLALVSAPNHPLQACRAVSLADVAAHPAVLPDLSTLTGRQIKAEFDRHHLPLQARFATNYLETIKMMVSVGLGWSLLPQSMLDSSLHTIDCSGHQFSRPLGFTHHKGKTLSNAARAFINELSDHAERSQ